MTLADTLPGASCNDHDLILDLLRFYQRELRSDDATDARAALSKLHIHSAEVVEHFALGFASGRVIDAVSEPQYKQLCALGLAKRRRDTLIGCVVVPVYNADGDLVDLCGLRPWASGLRFVHWQPSHRGLVGAAAVKASEGDALIVTDNPFHALHARQHGYTNVVGLRSATEIEQHLPLLEVHGIRRVYLVSRQQRHLIGPPLTRTCPRPVHRLFATYYTPVQEVNPCHPRISPRLRGFSNWNHSTLFSRRT